MQHPERVAIPTKAERQVLYYLREGLPFAEIAEMRGCSIRTIESHVHKLYQKAGLFYANRVALVNWATQNGYCEPLKPTAATIAEAIQAKAERNALKKQLLEALEDKIDLKHRDLKVELDEQLKISKRSILREAEKIIDKCLTHE